MDRNAWLAPLGLQRFRVLDCLGGTQPRSPAYLSTLDTDVLASFRTYVEDLTLRWANERHEQTTRLLAAARILIGDLSAADIIIDRFPSKAYKLDHGHGYCNVADLYALRAALPLPTALGNTACWLAGSIEQTALRSWLAEHRDQLRWVETDGTYVINR